ncbi:UNVERIFIED_ORG: hypothetical protein M2402_003622 [Rahnella aquatilis]
MLGRPLGWALRLSGHALKSVNQVGSGQAGNIARAEVKPFIKSTIYGTLGCFQVSFLYDLLWATIRLRVVFV